MSVKLLTEHHLEFLSVKGDCRGSFESTLVKMPHCWKSHVTAHFCFNELKLKLNRYICANTSDVVKNLAVIKCHYKEFSLYLHRFR